MAKNKFIVMVMVVADPPRTLKAPQLGEEAIYTPNQIFIKSGDVITSYDLNGMADGGSVPTARWDSLKADGLFVSGNTALPDWLREGKVYGTHTNTLLSDATTGRISVGDLKEGYDLSVARAEALQNPGVVVAA